jgi:hypothetical protein
MDGEVKALEAAPYFDHCGDRVAEETASRND